MTNFLAIDFLDVWGLSASLHVRQHLFEDGAIILHREGSKHPELSKWKNLRNVMSRVARHAANKGVELDRASIERLEPEQALDWGRGAAEGNQILHLPIVTNPSALMYSGVQQMHIPAGVLTWVRNDVLCSEANFGLTPRIHLVLEMRKKEAVQ